MPTQNTFDISEWCRKNFVAIYGTIRELRDCSSVSQQYDRFVDLGTNRLVMTYKGYVYLVPCDCCQELFLKGGRFLNG